MSNLESMDWWGDLLALKDKLSLKELADRFGVSAGAISASLRRTNTGRTPTAAPAEAAAPAAPKAATLEKPAPATVPTATAPVARAQAGSQAWLVSFQGGSGEVRRVVVASGVAEAAAAASSSALGRPVGIVHLGPIA